MMSMLLLAIQADAYECVENPHAGCASICMWDPGNSLTYNVVVSDSVMGFNVDLDAWHETAIENAAAGWRAGTSQRMRGANWEFVRGSDHTIFSSTNADNEVAMLENWAFDDICPGTEGCTTVSTNGPLQACTRDGWDLYFREESVRGENGADIPWADVQQGREDRDPDVTIGDPAFLEFSLESVLLHEFGHELGFDHNLTVSSVMGGYGVSNAGGVLSISEEEYDAMTSIKSHSSTGNNVSLSRITATEVNNGAMWNAERWDNYVNDVGEDIEGVYRMCIGADPVDPARVLAPIDVLHLGTSSLSNVVVQWRLRPTGTACGSGGSYLLDSRTIGTLASNTPFSALPDSNLTVPNGVTAGEWAFCARIDPSDNISETDEGDNIILSDPDQNILIIDDPEDPLCP